jgi:hypothetical protein
MKKFTANIQTLFFKPLIAALVLTSCASAPAKSGTASMPLEEAIEKSAFEISESFPAKTKIVVIEFDSLATELSEYIMEELNGMLIQQRKLTVIDRANLELIAKEMNFQLSGAVSDESMLEPGRMLGRSISRSVRWKTRTARTATGSTLPTWKVPRVKPP